MFDIDIQNDLKQFVLNTISIQVVEKICKFVHIQKTIFRVKIYMEKLLVHQLRTLKMVLSEITTWCLFALLILLGFANPTTKNVQVKWNSVKIAVNQVKIRDVTYAYIEEMARTKIKCLIAEIFK